MKPTGRQLIAEFIYCEKDILNNRDAIEDALKRAIKECDFHLKKIDSYQFEPCGVTSIAIIGESHIAIHTYPEADHASVDVFTCAPTPEKTLRLLESLKYAFKPHTVRTLEISRGNPLDIASSDWITTFSPNGFNVKYHVKKKLYDKTSPYQHIEVIENDNFGRMLFLDKDLQIAESDADIYNASLVPEHIGKRCAGKDIIILGGGDGGVLHEALKYQPRRIQLIDIDRDVIDCAKEYLKCICHDAFDDPRVEVINDDVKNFLSNMKERADLIAYDLHMHPEAFSNIDRETYISNLFSLVKGCLKRDGVLTLQCCSEFDHETLSFLKSILPRYFKEIEFNSVFIPSYCERWIFGVARIS